MNKCESCQYYTYDNSTGTEWCVKADYFTEKEVDDWIEANTENCKHYKEDNNEDI